MVSSLHVLCLVDLLVMLGDEFYTELSRDLVSVAAHTVVLKRPAGVFAGTLTPTCRRAPIAHFE
jgi:hypothetical protein